MNKSTQELINDFNRSAEQFTKACSEVFAPQMVETEKALKLFSKVMRKALKRFKTNKDTP